MLAFHLSTHRTSPCAKSRSVVLFVASVFAATCVPAAEPAEPGDGEVAADQTARVELFRKMKTVEAASEARCDDGDFEAEVIARRELVPLCVEFYGEGNWRAVYQDRLLRSAERAAVLSPERQVKLREARRRNLAGRRLAAEDRHADAEPDLRASATTADDLLGADAFTLEAAIVHGRTLNFLGRHREAADVLERAVLIGPNVYPEPHPRVAAMLKELAAAYLFSGRPDDAAEAGIRSFNITAATSDEAAEVASASAELAKLFLACRRYADAEKAASTGLAVVSYPTDDSATLSYLFLHHLLSQSYASQGRTTEARELLRETLSDATF